MILGKIRDYIRLHSQASLADIAVQMGAQPDAVRAMVEVWVRKGLVVRLPPAAGCGKTCRQCDSAQTEIYSWQEPGDVSLNVAAPHNASDCSQRRR